MTIPSYWSMIYYLPSCKFNILRQNIHIRTPSLTIGSSWTNRRLHQQCYRPVNSVKTSQPPTSSTKRLAKFSNSTAPNVPQIFMASHVPHQASNFTAPNVPHPASNLNGTKCVSYLNLHGIIVPHHSAWPAASIKRADQNSNYKALLIMPHHQHYPSLNQHNRPLQYIINTGTFLADIYINISFCFFLLTFHFISNSIRPCNPWVFGREAELRNHAWIPCLIHTQNITIHTNSTTTIQAQIDGLRLTISSNRNNKHYFFQFHWKIVTTCQEKFLQ